MDVNKVTNVAEQHKFPECDVVMRKLSLEEISRMIVSPFFIGNRCGLCNKFAYYGPKCTTCSLSYHYECALQRGMCCELPIILQEKKSRSSCPKCSRDVPFGPNCTKCHSKFHPRCLSVFELCCERNVYPLPPRRPCGNCKEMLIFGPRCPFCSNIFHAECVTRDFQCCNQKLICDDGCLYQCAKCFKNLGQGSPMCRICGKVYHNRCINQHMTCCGKPFELYFIPSFKYVMQYFNRLTKRQAQLKKLEETVTNHSHLLRSMIKNTPAKPERPRKKSTACQTYVLDNVAIVEVKSEVEMPEDDLPLPVLERQMSCTPEPSSSFSSHRPDSHSEEDDTLKNLFNFLYTMVKKFPPRLQTQVKIDLFRTVTEAEMKVECYTYEPDVEIIENK